MFLNMRDMNVIFELEVKSFRYIIYNYLLYNVLIQPVGLEEMRLIET